MSWSPAGARFLLDRFPQGSAADNAVFLASLDGTELSRVALGQGADWSSRGEIALGRYGAPACLPVCEDVFITRLGRTPRRFTYRGGSNPAWSPDGRWIAFIRNGDLYVIRPNGEDRRRLVNGAVTALGEGPQVQSIDWQPIPRR